MKKTLVALSVAAYATSASALTLFENESTNVKFDGSIRIVLEEAGKRAKDADGTKSGSMRSNLRNEGTRFGVSANHQLGDGFYALGRLEFRLDKDAGRDKWGSVYAKRAWAGFGKKELGQVTFGRQLTIADDYGQTDDYAYGIVPAYIKQSGNAVIRYDYKAIDGLTLSANYNFAQDTSDKNAPLGLGEAYKQAYGAGFVYEGQLGGNTFNAEGGYGRTNYETYANYDHHKDGYELALGYTIGDVKLVSDLGYKYEKNGSFKERGFFVAPGAQIQITPKSRIYGNYLYERLTVSGSSAKEISHGGLLGVDYKLHKQVVTFLEGKYVRTKDYDTSGQFTGRVDDKAIGVGMRIYW